MTDGVTDPVTGDVMDDALRGVGRSALVALAEALQSGRIGPPYGRAELAPYVPMQHVSGLVALLSDPDSDGRGPRQIARMLGLVIRERAEVQRIEDRVELVWSPAEFDEVDSRDTSVVVQDLFRRATRCILIVTYVLDDGAKAQALFADLAARMDAEPELEVRIVANVQRPHGDDVDAQTLVTRFAKRQRERVWPGK